jgi:hypothetical protein
VCDTVSHGLQIHPFGRVPALVDGEHVLFESGAILLYLGERYGGLDTLQKRCVLPVAFPEGVRHALYDSSGWQPALAKCIVHPGWPTECLTPGPVCCMSHVGHVWQVILWFSEGANKTCFLVPLKS